MGCSLSSSYSSSSSALQIPSLNDFQVADQIGQGGFARIYHTIYKPTNSCYAMKIIDIKACCQRKGGSEMLRSELQSLVSLAPHPFVAKLHYGFHDYVSCYLVFDLFEGGDLRSYLNTEYRFSEKMIAFFAGCIGSALRHIHSCGVLHRDIKPENIIFDIRGFPKLIDFGIAYVCPDETMICTNCSGTRLYSAPELFTPSHAHGPSADFWALGLVLYEMLYLSHPFRYHCPRDFMKFATKYSLFCKDKDSLQLKSSHRTTQCSNTITTRNREAILWTDDKANCPVESPSNRSQLQPSPHLPHSPSAAVDGFHRKSPQENPLPDSENTFKSQSANGPLEASDFDEFDALVLPSHLRVPLSFVTAYGEPISMECYEFLDELLDIRFDRRLGATAERYVEFMRHAWLAANGIHIPSLLSSFNTHTSPQTNTTAHVAGSSPAIGGVRAAGGKGHVASSACVSSSLPAMASPIKLNHEALKARLSKRQDIASGSSFAKESSLHLKPTKSFFGSMKPHRILPHDHPQDVLDILQSYRYSASY